MASPDTLVTQVILMRFVEVLQLWLVWPPAILIVITFLASNLLGDGSRDALETPTLKQ